MNKNVGFLDKIIRGIVGLILIYVASLTFSSAVVLSAIAFILALIAIITSFIGVCPIYKIFGINTKKKKEPPVPFRS